MSDCLRVSSEVCPCGRSYALIDGIEGRREDVLDLPSEGGGSVAIHPNVFHEVLDLAPLRAWQVREEPTGLHILIVGASSSFDDEGLAREIASTLSKREARAGHVFVERVDDIQRTAVGKAPLVQRLQRQPSAIA